MLALGRYPDIRLKRAGELHQEARTLVPVAPTLST
jgi:hypothetical protein